MMKPLLKEKILFGERVVTQELLRFRDNRGRTSGQIFILTSLLREKPRSAHVTSRMIIHAPIIVNSVCERKCCPRSIW